MFPSIPYNERGIGLVCDQNVRYKFGIRNLFKKCEKQWQGNFTIDIYPF
jgi:hypothetical protein